MNITKIIKEYDFDKASGEISFTGRQVNIPGVDGFTIDNDDKLYVGCWGKGHIAVVDTLSMSVVEYIPVPARIPTSCSFAGNKMEMLIVVTADLSKDKYAGFTFMKEMNVSGRRPYLFG